MGFTYAESDGDEQHDCFEVIRLATPQESRGFGLLYEGQPLWKVKRHITGGRMQPKPVADDYIRSKFVGMSHPDYARAMGLLGGIWDPDAEEEEDGEDEESEE